MLSFHSLSSKDNATLSAQQCQRDDVAQIRTRKRAQRAAAAAAASVSASASAPASLADGRKATQKVRSAHKKALAASNARKTKAFKEKLAKQGKTAYQHNKQKIAKQGKPTVHQHRKEELAKQGTTPYQHRKEELAKQGTTPYQPTKQLWTAKQASGHAPADQTHAQAEYQKKRLKKDIEKYGDDPRVLAAQYEAKVKRGESLSKGEQIQQQEVAAAAASSGRREKTTAMRKQQTQLEDAPTCQWINHHDHLWLRPAVGCRGVDVAAQTNKSYSDKYMMNSTGCFVKDGSHLLLFETECQTYL